MATSWRAANWNRAADKIIDEIQKYENEHPDDAKCLAEINILIDGKPFQLQEVPDGRQRPHPRRRR